MRRVVFVLTLLTFGCTFHAGQVPTAFPTATTVRSVPATLPPTVARVVSSLSTPTPAPPTQTATLPPTVTLTATHAPTVTPTPDGCQPPADADTQHTVDAEVDYEAKTVTVAQSIRYTNQTDTPLPVLVLNVEPNRWLEAFTLQDLTLGDDRAPGAYTLTGRRLEVSLPEPLLPDCTANLHLNFTLQVPPIIGGVEAFRGYFGHSPRQINLGHWLPTVAPRRDGDWLHHESIFVGEQIVLDRADWQVTLRLVNAAPNTLAAAPGTVTQLDDASWQFDHPNGREFAVSISPVFRHTQAQSGDGIAVDVYALPDATIWQEETQQWLDGGAYAAEITAESVDLYADKFGDYPHTRMVVVQGDFPDGMEFSGFAFVSTDWFVSYEGSPQSYLMLITVHEVAHQWWYDLVGNDQAYDPWLDEALSTYSEYIYIEAFYPEHMEWWWFFRVNRLNPQGAVNSSVYEFEAIRPYINAVYLRGVLMLHDMRAALGDDAFYGWLRAYAEAHAGDIADSDSLWAALTNEQLAATAVIRTAFLRAPGVAD